MMKNFKYIFCFLVLCRINFNSIANQVDLNDLSKYVYPANISSSPRMIEFMPDGNSFLSLSDDNKQIIMYSTEKGTTIDTILDVNNTRETRIDKISGFSINKDGSKLLVYNNINQIYRRSFEATYYVFECKRNILKPLSLNHNTQRSPLFSPDGRMVAFVAENNIYIKKLDYDSEVAVTIDGKKNEIINGVPDWTYEEEFMVESSMVWAPDNLALSFIKYNEQNVNSYSFPIYSQWNSNYSLYPSEYTYKYPKAGTLNSKVSVFSYDIDTRKLKQLQLKAKDVEYIPKISYANDSESLVIATLNRQQNKFELLLANPKTTLSKTIYTDNSKSWIDEICYNNIKFYPEYFVVSSSRTGFNHIYKYSYSGVLLSQITNGNYDVLDYYGKDTNDVHYFQSTKSGAINRIISKIDKKGKEIDITPLEGCASALFSPLMNYYIINYSNVNNPPVYTLYGVNNKKIRVLDDNSHVAKKYTSLPKREFLEIQSENYSLNGYIIKPDKFDASKKYPVIMTLYNGPSSQIVLNKWVIDWENYFATKGYIIACFDGRGTAGRGHDFKSIVYKNLGYYETIDQINAANYIKQLSYVDSSKIGIYGWSYGGYGTLMAISHSQSPFSAAVAIAPVTDWKFYDTAYTERFMLSPQENEDGYISSSAINKIDNIKCPLLIISGTADDNVHLQNTLEYVSAMINNGKYCDMFLFPDMNHSINGGNSRAVVYAKMLDYFNKNLGVK